MRLAGCLKHNLECLSKLRYVTIVCVVRSSNSLLHKPVSLPLNSNGPRSSCVSSVLVTVACQNCLSPSVRALSMDIVCISRLLGSLKCFLNLVLFLLHLLL